MAKKAKNTRPGIMEMDPVWSQKLIGIAMAYIMNGVTPGQSANITQVYRYTQDHFDHHPAEVQKVEEIYDHAKNLDDALTKGLMHKRLAAALPATVDLIQNYAKRNNVSVDECTFSLLKLGAGR
jgi:hypothetical protein